MVCTTCGLSVALVERAATAMPSSADGWCLRTTLKIINAPANSAPNTTILPLLVLKKLRKSRGFISAFGWTDGMNFRGIGDSDGWRRRGKARHQNRERIFQR